MSAPSSQILAVWIQEDLRSTDWTLLREVLYVTLRKRWGSASDEDMWDCIEERGEHVANDLRNCIAEWQLDGTPPRIEIDNDPSPYIRLVLTAPSELIAKLRRINPFEFETVCARVLDVLGASSHTTKKTNDNGVDFIGVNLNALQAALSLPASCRALVIGQAKRYKEGSLIGETRLREFVGAAILEKHRLLKEGTIGPLAPVLLAFWTTSGFDPNAKRFARELGLWYMDGLTLAAYVSSLGLEAYVMSLTDEPEPLPVRDKQV